MEENLLKTCLYDKHIALGAQMSPFGGFIMPIQYTNITDEHNAVRHRAGMFDVSHMGEIFVSGPDAEKFVSRAVDRRETYLGALGAYWRDVVGKQQCDQSHKQKSKDRRPY